DEHAGWWRVLAVDPPRKLEFEDGFADENGDPNLDMPTMVSRVELSESGAGATSVTVETKFGSLEAMEQLIEMGMEEGAKQAFNQIDALL
ncbi:MAG: SRPBCC domain-containing protein, partial [Acidimicrobiia bacterium]